MQGSLSKDGKSIGNVEVVVKHLDPIIRGVFTVEDSNLDLDSYLVKSTSFELQVFGLGVFDICVLAGISEEKVPGYFIFEGR